MFFLFSHPSLFRQLKEQHHQPHHPHQDQQMLPKQQHQPPDKDDTTLGTQKVYKKASANSQLILYLPTREIILYGTTPTIVKGVVFLDNPKLTADNRVFAQLTLTFR